MDITEIRQLHDDIAAAEQRARDKRDLAIAMACTQRHYTQREIAENLNITRQHVGRIITTVRSQHTE